MKLNARTSTAGQNERCYLFHLFYQVQIRLGSSFPTLRGDGKVEETWAERDDTANTAITGHAHDEDSRRIGNRRP